MLPCPRGANWVRDLGRGAELDAALITVAGRACVLKRARRDLPPDAAAAAVEGLRRDAAALAWIGGRGAPRLLDQGSDEAGPFTLQSFIASPPLDVAAARDPGEARRLALRLVDVVTDLHALADGDGPLLLSHGDLAPDHVRVDDEEITLVDFGAAAFRDALPRPGHRGTSPFVAPELVRGEADGSPAADRYAVGVIVATLLAGRPPLRAREPAAQLGEIGDRGHDLTTLSSVVPKAVVRALEAVLAFSPATRSPDLAPLRAALAASATS